MRARRGPRPAPSLPPPTPFSRLPLQAASVTFLCTLKLMLYLLLHRLKPRARASSDSLLLNLSPLPILLELLLAAIWVLTLFDLFAVAAGFGAAFGITSLLWTLKKVRVVCEVAWACASLHVLARTAMGAGSSAVSPDGKDAHSGWQVRFLFASVVTGGLMVVLFAFSLFTGAKRSVDTLLHLLVNWYVLTIAVTYWPSRLPKLSSAGGGWGSATAELMKPDMARE